MQKVLVLGHTRPVLGLGEGEGEGLGLDVGGHAVVDGGGNVEVVNGPSLPT